MKFLGKVMNIFESCFLLFLIDEHFGNNKKIEFLNKYSLKKLENTTEEEFIKISSIYERTLYRILIKNKEI